MADRPNLGMCGPCTVSTTLSVEEESSDVLHHASTRSCLLPRYGHIFRGLLVECMYEDCALRMLSKYRRILLSGCVMYAGSWDDVSRSYLWSCLPSLPTSPQRFVGSSYSALPTPYRLLLHPSIPMIYQGVIGLTATTSRSCLLWLPEPSSTLHWVSSWLDLDRHAVGRPRELPSSASC